MLTRRLLSAAGAVMVAVGALAVSGHAVASPLRGVNGGSGPSLSGATGLGTAHAATARLAGGSPTEHPQLRWRESGHPPAVVSESRLCLSHARSPHRCAARLTADIAGVCGHRRVLQAQAVRQAGHRGRAPACPVERAQVAVSPLAPGLLSRFPSEAAVAHVRRTAPSSPRPRLCNRETVVSPPDGGYGVIIENLRVLWVSCRVGRRVVSAEVTHGRAVGWRCAAGASVTTCRRGRRRVSFAFGGDAG